MRRLIVSIHSTAIDIVTGPPSDKTNFMVWAQAGIEDSLDIFEVSGQRRHHPAGTRHLRRFSAKVAEG